MLLNLGGSNSQAHMSTICAQVHLSSMINASCPLLVNAKDYRSSRTSVNAPTFERKEHATFFMKLEASEFGRRPAGSLKLVHVFHVTNKRIKASEVVL